MFQVASDGGCMTDKPFGPAHEGSPPGPVEVDGDAEDGVSGRGVPVLIAGRAAMLEVEVPASA